MTIPGSAHPLLMASLAGPEDYQIQRSLRFNSADSSHLSKTFSSAGNRKTWTWSAWVKRTKLATQEIIFQANNSGNLTSFYFNSSDTALFLVGGSSIVFQTSRVFRDPSSWMHLVIAVDTTQSTAFDRIKFYVNGVKLTSDQYSTAPAPSPNTEYEFNNACAHYLSGTTYGHANSYMADVHFVDGQALAPTDFGEPDDNNVWQPKEFEGNHNYAGSTTAINTLEFTGNGPHGFHAIRVDGTILTGADYTNGTLGSWSSNTTNPGGSFDGNLTGGNLAYSNNGSAITWTSNGGLSYNSKVEIYVGNISPFYVNINGGGASSALTTNSWNTIAESGAGVNGFHLDFSDASSNAALGYDAAGSNDWTVNNLTAGPAIATGAVSGGTPANASGSGGWDQAFDGSTTNLVYNSSSGTTSTFTLHDSISWSSKIRIYAGQNATSGTNIIANGTNLSSSHTWPVGGGWQEVTSSLTSPLTSLALVNVGGQSSNIRAIEIDDTIVVQIKGENVDSLVDTPTNYGTDSGLGGEVRGNYATLNPVAADSGYTLTNGNLQASGNVVYGHAPTTIYASSGKFYCEFTLTTYQADTGVGVAASIANPDSDWIGQQAYTVGYLADGRVFQSGGSTSYSSYAVGDVIGVAFDVDTGKVWFAKNNTWQNSGDPAAGTGQVKTISGGYSLGFTFRSVGSGAGTFNFGQRGWAFAPPSGYKALNTASLPEPTIADGSAYFDTVLYTGDGNTTQTISLPFNPGFTWLKKRSGASSHYWHDAIRGFSESKGLTTHNTAAEGFNSAYYSMSQSGSSLTIGDVSPGNEFNINGQTHVIWTWDAGANSSKTYAVTVVSDSGNKYRFDGHGTSAVTLDLEEGSTYTFDQSDSSNAGHPLRFSTTSDGTHGSGSEYTTGVVTNGTPGSAGAYTKITIASGAPTLYYYCSVHSGMGGQVNTNSTAGATVLSGSLNSSLYDQSQTWSNGLSGTQHGSYPITQAFDSNLSTVAYAALNNTITVTLPGGSIALSTASSLRVYASRYGSTNTFFVNGNNYTTQISNSVGWYTITGETQITSFGIGNYNTGNDYTGIYAIEVNGKLLVDSGVSVTNVPSINSVVRANPAAGFSVVRFTGYTYYTDYTLAHGLNAAPEFIIARDSSLVSQWTVYHSALTSGHNLYLNLTSSSAARSSTNIFAGNPTSSVFTYRTNNGGTPHEGIAYCFAPVEGYSAMGSYTANALDNGPFVHTGFRPKWIMIKHATGTTTGYSSWIILDTERDTYNVSDASLLANRTSAEGTRGDGSGTAGPWMDILSNGFKIRYSWQVVNGTSGDKYIYMAFAENPFKTARAR